MPLEPRTLSALNFKERDLQKWLIQSPNALGEKLLIIQEEFAGFYETDERFDLLALDKEGRLVIIENKRDDSGKDVTWQALKYVAYCSTLSKSQIVKIYQKHLNELYHLGDAPDASDSIINFFGKESIEEVDLNSRQTQRFILVATSFPKEVTSTVLWLIDNGIDARCIKVTPYQADKKLLLNFTQIIPPPEVKDYMIRMSSKDREEKDTKTNRKIINQLRKKFWKRVLEFLKERKYHLYQDSEPTHHSYLSAKTEINGCYYAMGIYNDCAWVGFCIWSKNKYKNKKIFNFIEKKDSEIQNRFGKDGHNLVDEGPYNKIYYNTAYYKNFDSYNEENWQSMIEWLFENIQKIEKTFKPLIPEIKKHISITASAKK